MGYETRPQSIERLEKIKKVLEYFDKHGGTIDEISAALGISKSSVQRYLKEATDSRDRQSISEYLAANKREGTKRGGKTTQQRHGFDKDELGHFTGSRKK